MRILFVADGRSPIALRWLETVRALGHTVSLISTFACQRPAGVENFHILPTAFSGVISAPGGKTASPSTSRRRWISSLRTVFLQARYFLGPLTIPSAARPYQSLLHESQPDFVHALRIPYEGMLAAHTPPEFPLVISIWGNDLTLHAGRSPWMRSYTRRALARADGLHTDAQRDMRLALAWGYPAGRPRLVVPTNGGIDLQLIRSGQEALPSELAVLIPEGHTAVINPRGIRAYTCTETFFKAIPLILERRPQTTFLCPGMAGERAALHWVHRLNLDRRTTLLPGLPQSQLWALFARAPISVSVTTHDGTPNTLLEAMACGSFPVAGDIESLREWIEPGVNGLLVDPHDPSALARAVLEALEDANLRQNARRHNLALIQNRAEVSWVRPQIEAFYQSVALLR